MMILFSFFKYLCKFIKVSNQKISNVLGQQFFSPSFVAPFSMFVQVDYPIVSQFQVSNQVISLTHCYVFLHLVHLVLKQVMAYLVTKVDLSQSCPKCCSKWLTPFFPISQYWVSCCCKNS